MKCCGFSEHFIKQEFVLFCFETKGNICLMNMILFDKLPENNVIPASDERAQHITSVLKLKAGDSFRMGIVNESEGTSVVRAIEEGNVSFDYEALSPVSMYPLTLIVAQVRPICMKRILREAVSLGVEKIILCGTDTGEKSYRDSNLYKTGEYLEYVLDGAMQACHAGVSEVAFADSVQKAVLMTGRHDDTSYVLLDNAIGATPLSKAELKEKVVLAIGPERGFSDRERHIFADNGYLPMLLGSRVLRTETACSAGTAVALSRMGLL